MPEQVRTSNAHPLRLLVMLVGGSLLALAALMSAAAAGRSAHASFLRPFQLVRSDTDSVATGGATLADSLLRGSARIDSTLRGRSSTDTLAAGDSTLAVSDSTLVDSLALPDTGLASRYLPGWRRDALTASPTQRKKRPFSARIGTYWRHEVRLDSTDQSYVATERVGNQEVRFPLRMNRDEYRRSRLSADLDAGWRRTMEERQRQQQQRQRGGLGFNIAIPGGQQSAIATIFGKPDVSLRVNGQADIKAGFDYRRSDQQIAYTGRASQVDPDFKQDLRLGITGMIGDKLEVNVNWDTNNQFEYQNQLKLQYTGYEDEIIQRIEAGNVFLNTPSRLIRGGQSLFGIKSELQLGGLRLTTVASQQEGQSNSLAIQGGSEETPFDLKPTDYESDTHFFLGYYFRNRWEEALKEPSLGIILANEMEPITEIEVWKLQPTSAEDLNVRQVIAMVDLGESPELLKQANGFTRANRADLPDADNDQYDAASVENFLRNGQATPSEFLKGSQLQEPLRDSDFQPGAFKKLERGRDYTLDPALGFISLRQRLRETEAIAVAYRYVAGGRMMRVGDYSTETGGSSGSQYEDRLVLKLLRPVQPRQPSPETGFNPAAWYLELRNIYRIPGRALNLNEFDLHIYHEPPGKTAIKTIPDIGRQTPLLNLLGLDRVNEDGRKGPDDRFDKIVGYTIDPATGRLIFPYLEPFGSRISRLIADAGGTEEEQRRKRDLYVFTNLYQQKRDFVANRDTQLDVYRIRGSYRGSVQDFYDLRAYSGLIEGSVQVTSGGSRLAEGVDYVVDYQGGTLTITNPAHLSAGRDIEINYEQNSFFNIQKKTLLGARADYDFGQSLKVGGTVMSLNQKSPIDKFRLGEEPISNTIWGVDGSLQLEPRWLTRAIDALPFIQTRAPSSIQITGEFAQLRPGASETVAFDRTRRQLRKTGLDFKEDELSGISYIDDFEGFRNSYSLKQPGGWRLSAPPDSIQIIDPFPGDPERQQGLAYDSLRTFWRGTLAWYQLNQTIIAEVASKAPVYDARAVSTVRINEVYPNKDTEGLTDKTIQTLDFYYHPKQRGPYNYTPDLKGFVNNPAATWGGVVQRLPEGYTDFGLKNIEFVEFVFRPFAENQQNDAGAEAKLYIDLGSISEDIIPNGRVNTEDGLSLNSAGSSNFDRWSRTTSSVQNGVVDVDGSTLRTEDVGLDGLASYGDGIYPPEMTEQHHFRNWLDSLLPLRDDPDPRVRAEVEKALHDPSGDDYHYFNSNTFFSERFFPLGASFQDRFTRWFPGHELNSFEGQTKIARELGLSDDPRGNSRTPDSEDFNSNSAHDTQNSFFQYEVPLSRSELSRLAVPHETNDFVVNEITDNKGTGTGWYQIRIPVRDFTRRVGDINDFSLIESIRMWTTGHEVPVTMRFATLELVGSQWQKADQIALERETAADTLDGRTRLSISSINNEENLNTYRTPDGTIVSQTRLATGTTQRAREQAMVLRVEELLPGKQRAVYRTNTQGTDLLKYSNLRMFVHLQGKTADGQDITERDKVRLFVRLGSNETNDYYEYEQPLSPSRTVGGSADDVWQTNQDYNGRRVDLNSVNLVLGALNQLKVARDETPNALLDELFWSHSDDGQPNESVTLSPDVADFAPPGTRLAIKGNPSLGRINTIVIGVRNPADSLDGMSKNLRAQDILEDVTIWVNEMRVAGYDETNGTAAMANADIRLADLGSIKASFQAQSDGFGGLASTLGQREQNQLNNWSVTSDFNMHKFIPERFGWSVPVSIQVQSNTSTPRFSPQRGDIRLEELLAQIDNDEHLSDAERAQKRQEAMESAQTHTFTRSISTRLQKQGSRSRLLRNTIDGISFNYAWSDNNARNPSQRLNDAWRWSTTLGYRFSTRQPHTVRPFWFLEDLPVLGALGGLQFSYLPQSLQLSGNAARNISQSQERPSPLRSQQEGMPEEVAFPLREQHALSHRRTFTLQYNPLQFLNLSFDTNTSQSLNALGVDTLFTVMVVDGDGNAVSYPNLTLDQAIAEKSIIIDGEPINEQHASTSAFEVTRLRVLPTSQVFNRIFAGDDLLRTERHDQRFTGTFRPNFTRIPALNWLNIQDVVFGANFNWQNGAVGSNTGANVGNQVELRGGVSLRPQEFFRKFGFYKSLEQQQRDADTKAQQERREREQERLRRKEANRKRKEEERRRKVAGEELESEEEEDGVDEDEPMTAPPVEGATEEEGSGGFKLPLPDPMKLLRQTVLAVTGMRDFTVTYTGTRNSSSNGVGNPLNAADSPYSLFDAVRGHGPDLGYRFGFERRVGLDRRIVSSALQVSDVLSNNNKIQARTSLQPSQALQINLNWNVDWDEGENVTYRPGEGYVPGMGHGIDMSITSNGSNRASIWAFGASYLDLFERQLNTYLSDAQRSANPDAGIGDEDGDGRVVLTNRTVVSDFQQAYMGGLGTVDGLGLLPFPMPGWQVSYSGISKWPLLNRLVENATVRHGYTSDYSTDFRTNIAARGDGVSSFDLGQRKIMFTVPENEVGGVRINERFQPMVGLDLTWKGRIQTNFAWNKSNAYSLSATSFEVGEQNTSEFTFTGTYQRTGMRLPFFGNKLNNRINFSLTLARAGLSDQRFRLKPALVDALTRQGGDEPFVLEDAISGDNISLISASTRTTVTPQISYQFSNRVNASFSMRYENFASEDSRQPSSTTLNGGFNVRVSISN